MDKIALIFDVVLVAIFIICVYNGGRNGFIRAIASLLASFIALVGAGYLTANVAPVVAEKYVSPAIGSAFENRLEESLGQSLETVDSIISSTEDMFSSVTAIFNVDGIVKDAEAEVFEETDTEIAEEVVGEVSEDSDAEFAEEVVDEVGENSDTEIGEEPTGTKKLVANISETIGGFVTSVLMFIVLFALLLALLRAIIDKLRFVNKIPIIGALNMLLGAVLGAITGTLILGIPLWLIVNVLPGVFNVESILSPSITENSFVISLLMDFFG